MSEENKNNGLKIVLGILALLLIGASVMFFLKNNELNDTKKALETDRDNLKNELVETRDQLTQRIQDNEVLDEKLIQKRDSINLTIEQLSSSEAKVEELAKYKSSYFRLKKDIQKLLKDNEELQLQNTRLTLVNDTLVGQLDSQLKLSDSLTSKVTDAQRLIESASEISIVGLKGIALIQKSSGKQIPTTRARRADKVKICFALAENKIAEQGTKVLYVQVLDAKNNVLGKNDVIEFEDKILNYSYSTEFNYTNKTLDICNYLQAPKDGFEKGNYFVNVFRGNKLVSNSSFSLD
ncbi:MAG: hypothetical protein ACPG45_02930 [Flavobacteriaceae bacterium]